MTAPSAWQLEQAMSALMAGRARLLDADPDLASDEAALTAALGVETDTVMDMIHGMLRASVVARSMADASDTMARDIMARRDRYKRRAEALRATVFAAMDAAEIARVELPDLTASIANGRASVVITDETALPDEYVRIERAPNKAAINDAVKQGVVIPGVEVSNAMPTLTVRTK